VAVTSFNSILFSKLDEVTGCDSAPDCFADLHLDNIVTAIARAPEDEYLKRFFYAPLREVSSVEYRHRVFEDLDRDEIREPIQQFVDDLRGVRRLLERASSLWHPLGRQGWFISAVQSYCTAITLLHETLLRAKPRSPGLRDFSDYVAAYVGSDIFQGLTADTTSVQAQLHEVRYTVHIQSLRVHVEKYSGEGDYSLGVIDTFERFATEARDDHHVPLKSYPDMNHVEEQILECVAKLYPDTFSLMSEYCHRTQNFVEPVMDRFEREVRFYLAYLDFVGLFGSAPVSFSYPEVTADPGVLSVDSACDLALAIGSVAEDKPLVSNDFRLAGAERILVVTGPNQGGKTTLARTIGQCVYLASLGCPIAAQRATVMLPDQIYTHFERQETLATLHGKLDDELVRIHDILTQASTASLIVMNESFSSTTVHDALVIGTEVLHRIIELDCFAVYVSFLDELADLSPACVSMVGDVAPDDPTRRTFTFTRRPADGLAYAAALADKYGLQHDVLRRRVSR
jgi:DNA mismatch repair protein MutS